MNSNNSLGMFDWRKQPVEGGGEEAGKGSARVGRAAAVEERMVGKRSIGVPTFSCTVARKSYKLIERKREKGEKSEREKHEKKIT